MSQSRLIVISLSLHNRRILFIQELTGGDGDKKDGGNEEEDPEVK
jgi:hypothetical protein